jgi:capsular exopolysaccharide synthesis family protein
LKHLNVSRGKGSGNSANNILEVSFSGTRADECATVVNAVLESYKDEIEDTYRNTADDTLKLLTRARDELLKQLSDKEKEYLKFRKNSPFLLSRGRDGAVVSQERLGSLEGKRSSLLLRKAEIQGHLTVLDDGQKKGSAGRAALLAAAAEWVARPAARDQTRPGAPAVSIQAELLRLLAEKEQLLERRGPKHPEVEAVEKRIEITRRFLTNPAAPWEEGPADRPADPLAQYQAYFRQQLAETDTALQLVDRLYTDEKSSARALELYEVEDENLRGDKVRVQKLYDSLVERLKDAKLVTDVGGYKARVIAPPKLGRKVSPRVLFVFPVGLLAGLLLGLSLAYLAEVTDKSFHDADEARRRLRLPLVGHIPRLKPADERLRLALAEGRSLDPLLCAYFRPQSAEAEAYRGVRTALYFSSAGAGYKLLQITSPTSGDGKTTLAANLAVSIAQSGKRVLLVDADLRRPRVHAVFGLAPDVGLGSIILGEAEPAEAIQESGVPGLWLLPCGPIPPNPAELLTSPRFKELLDLLRQQYDFVLVDTPPLLAVTDPSVVAARVDGVLLNVRMAKNGRPAAVRARELLATLGARVLGLVVNDPEHRAGTGGYGYGYGYGYRTDEDDSPAAHRAGRNGQGTPAGAAGEGDGRGA